MKHESKRTPSGPSGGGGIFVAFALLAGAGVGIYLGQPSLGLLGGLVAGLAIATVHWMLTRSR